MKGPVAVPALSKAEVCCRRISQIVGSNSTGGVNACLL